MIDFAPRRLAIVYTESARGGGGGLNSEKQKNYYSILYLTHQRNSIPVPYPLQLCV